MYLNSFNTYSSQSKTLKITWRKHNTTINAILISTTGCRSIWQEMKCYYCRRSFIWQALRSSELDLWDLSRCWSAQGRQPIDQTSGSDSRTCTMSSMCPSLSSISLEACLLIHLIQSKWKVKSTSQWRPCYSIGAEAILGSTQSDGQAMVLSTINGFMNRNQLIELERC